MSYLIVAVDEDLGIGLNNTLIAQPLANKIGTYTLTVTKTSNGCTATDDVNVLIDTVRPTAYAGDDQMFGCPHLPMFHFFF